MGGGCHPEGSGGADGLVIVGEIRTTYLGRAKEMKQNESGFGM